MSEKFPRSGNGVAAATAADQITTAVTFDLRTLTGDNSLDVGV